MNARATLVVAVVAILVAGCCKKPSEKRGGSVASEDKPAKPAVKEKTVKEVKLGTLLDDYKENEVSADEKYQGQWIKTSGMINEVKKDVLGNAFLMVGTGKVIEIPQLRCILIRDHESKASGLSKGDKVRVKGRVQALHLHVVAQKCEIVE